MKITEERAKIGRSLVGVGVRWPDMWRKKEGREGGQVEEEEDMIMIKVRYILAYPVYASHISPAEE